MRPPESCTLFALLLTLCASGGAAAPPPAPPSAAKPVAKPVENQVVARFQEDVRWLADDAREGRGIGTRGLTEARDWIAARFQALGVQPAGEAGSWFQTLRVPTSVEVAAAGTGVTIDGRRIDRQAYQPAGFSASTRVEAAVVAAGYGITAPDLGVDDYAGLDVKGKVVAVRRFTPKGGPFEQEDHQRRHGDLRAKAWNAREHGAVGLIVVDAPPPGVEETGEAPLPEPAIEAGAGAAAGDAGIPVVLLTREVGAPLFVGRHRAGLAVELTRKSEPAQNVIGVIRAGAPDRLPGAVLVGAHYDHIGMGGRVSLAPGVREIHNGADDNASGVAALVEVARRLVERRSELRRDVWLVAFTGEELGTLGSTALTRQPPTGLRVEDLVGMLNMDMVGRLRDLGKLSVLGGDSAEEWKTLMGPLCERAALDCVLSGDGFGASDHSVFYGAGVPVLHFFTGTHEDYHKPSDDTEKIDAAGGVKVAGLVTDATISLAGWKERLAYKSAPAPAPRGDLRASGASLGTVPDYAGDGRPGVLLAGVRPGSAAEVGGLKRGDLLVELAGTEIRDIHDLMFVLRRAKPGEKADAVVDRAGEKLKLHITFEASKGMR